MTGFVQVRLKHIKPLRSSNSRSVIASESRATRLDKSNGSISNGSFNSDSREIFSLRSRIDFRAYLLLRNLWIRIAANPHGAHPHVGAVTAEGLPQGTR